MNLNFMSVKDKCHTFFKQQPQHINTGLLHLLIFKTTKGLGSRTVRKAS